VELAWPEPGSPPRPSIAGTVLRMLNPLGGVSSGLSRIHERKAAFR
jgi:hypothetical protein